MEMSHGYVVIIDHNHPFAHSRGRILEHRVVMEKKLRRYLKPKEVVHHINGIKTDNRPENLELCSTAGQHVKNKHWDKIGPDIHTYICENCKEEFQLTGKGRSNRNGRFCCYKCFNDWRTPKITCSKCSLKIHSRGLCNTHYRFLLRHLSG
jgi:hypothetical protein